MVFLRNAQVKQSSSVETHTLENGENITIQKTKKENFKPRFSTFCDGRKAVSQETNEPILCKKSGLEFWCGEKTVNVMMFAEKHTHHPNGKITRWKMF